MVRQLLGFFPRELLHCPPGVAALGVVLGLVLWVCGARFSRSILTLTAVAVGTFIGMHLPEWRGWHVDGMGLAVGGAIVLGGGAFLFQGTCIGCLLGGGMMLWAAAGTWIFLAGGAAWDWHGVHWDGDMVQYVREAWRGLPPRIEIIFPVVCLAALGTGIAIATWMPKLARVLVYSLMGVTLAAAMSALVLRAQGPHALSAAPGTAAGQGMILIGLVLLGAIVQWQITPPYRRATSPAARNP